jgi:hypothetical protein
MMGEGKGGKIHRECQGWMVRVNRSLGTIVVRERMLGNRKLVDVVVYDLKTKKLLGIEVQLSSKHALENIKADFTGGCDHVLIASPYPNVLENIRRTVDSTMPMWIRERVDYFHIDFIPKKEKNNNKNKPE